MMHVAFLLLLVFTVGVPCKKVCSYHDILDHLNLTTDNSVFKMTRPVLDHTHITMVELDIALFAILGVFEKTQTFIPFLWSTMRWRNERISWDPAQFCGITRISVPKDMIWVPDLIIYEMMQKDDSPVGTHISVSYNGLVNTEEDIKVVSTCRMDVHKFPFDIQRCNITVGSSAYSVDELQLLPFSNSCRVTQFSREMIRTQGEWEFIQISVISSNGTYYGRTWEQIIYTFTIKRRPLLHVINFLLPVLFFLSLDLASFFINDHRGEKLGFKVTVLLAISVLLLILNEILPAMSNKTPLIATYCIVIFALMLLSLLETILVTYLMDRDSASQEKLRFGDNGLDKAEKVRKDNCEPEDKKQTHCSCICKASDGNKQRELLPAAQEINSIQFGDSHVLLLILEQLRDLQTTLDLHLCCRQEGGRCVRWAARINKAFFAFYLTTVSIFLLLIFTEWNS